MSRETEDYLPFTNRAMAGRVLADELENVLADGEYTGPASRKHTEPYVVLALPRGGVPVAAVIAERFDALLDLILVRKLGLPGYEEFAMGAIASGNIRVLNEGMLERHRVTKTALDRVAAEEGRELERRELVYRGDRPFPALAGRRVILVDDGLATGATMRAALQVVRKQAPLETIMAVPVAPATTLEEMRHEADRVVCPASPEPFLAIGRWYRDFGQTTDEEVKTLLDRAWQH